MSPPTHRRDISVPSLQAQDTSVRHRPFAARRKGNIWPDAAQQHRTSRSHLRQPFLGSQGASGSTPLSVAHAKGVSREQTEPSPSKNSTGTNPGHSGHPSPPARCKQAPGKPAAPCAQEVPKTSQVPKTCSGDGDTSLALAQPPEDDDSRGVGTGPSGHFGGCRTVKSRLLSLPM